MNIPSARAIWARDRAATLAGEGRTAEAEAVLRTALADDVAEKDFSGQYVVLQALAELLRSRERRVEAVPVFLEALSACVQAQGSADELGRLQASLVFTFVNIGLPDQATEHAAAALALADRMSRLDERIRVLNAVALASTRLGHFRTAKSLYSQIIREGRGEGGASGSERGRAIINLGVCLNDEARTLDAADPMRMRLLRRQLRCGRAALTTELRRDNALAAKLNNTEALIMLGRLEEASAALSALDSELQASTDTELRAFARGMAARIAVQRGEVEQAASLFEVAISLFESINSLDEVPGLLEELSKAKEACGLLKDALQAERTASAMRRARAQALAHTRMRVVEARHELELARREADARRAMETRIEQQRAQLKTQTEALSLAVRTDPLTGLGNRRMMEEVAQVLKEPSGVPFSVALIDVDHFKHINDTYSHMIGDQVLRAIAGLIRDNCRPTDVGLRYGGEEFALILPGMNREVAARVCERLRLLIQGFNWESIRPGMRVTVSIGLACEVCPADLGVVLERADQCLYAAKNGGRNRLRTDQE